MSEDIFGISNFLVKLIINLLLEPLLDLINWSLNDGLFEMFSCHTNTEGRSVYMYPI